MIKGVNRQMVEITDTGNIYFERAFLVVRPGFTAFSEEQISREGREFVRNAGGYSGLMAGRRARRRRYALLAGAGGLAGIAIGSLVTLLIR